MNLTYSGDEAFQITRANPARAWIGANGHAAQARYDGGDFMQLQHTPKFFLNKDDPVFTVGSCFAREVENVLLAMKVPLALDGHGIQNQYLASWDEARDATPARKSTDPTRGALNKYSVHSMTHDIRRSLKDEEYPDSGLIELSEDKWFDPHSSGMRLLPREAALESRARIALAMKQVTKAKVMFITLGLTESWLDTETGLVMNAHPGAAYARKFGSRFQFIDYGFQEILDEMRSLLALVKTQAQPGIRFIVTVSPVPLGSTFRIEDIIVANSGSKSTLRTVAEQLRREFDDVDYFPSYEFVMNSPRAIAFKEDQLHVAGGMVRHIMQNFQKMYYGMESA
jgi:hypothetical protein